MIKNRKVKSIISLILSICMIIGMMPVRGTKIVRAFETTLQNPRIVVDSNMKSGQKVTWDCVWFGSYPQTEVTKLTSNITGATYDSNGEAVVDGVKYKRICKNDSRISPHGIGKLVGMIGI